MTRNELISKALSDSAEESAKNYLDSTQMQGEHIFSDEYNEKIAKLFKRDKKASAVFFGTAFRRVATVFTIVLVISASGMSIRAVRDKVTGLFTHKMSDHNEIVVNVDDSDNCPVTIEKKYDITPPSDYTLTDFSDQINYRYLCYENDDSNIIFHQICRADYSTSVDNERSTVEYYTDDNGQEYTIYKWDSPHTLVIWDNGEYIFEVSTYSEVDFAMEMVKSIHEAK